MQKTLNEPVFTKLDFEEILNVIHGISTARHIEYGTIHVVPNSISALQQWLPKALSHYYDFVFDISGTKIAFLLKSTPALETPARKTELTAYLATLKKYMLQFIQANSKGETVSFDAKNDVEKKALAPFLWLVQHIYPT